MELAGSVMELVAFAPSGTRSFQGDTTNVLDYPSARRNLRRPRNQRVSAGPVLKPGRLGVRTVDIRHIRWLLPNLLATRVAGARAFAGLFSILVQQKPVDKED